MKRTLTSIAAASMALGTLVPVAFASTSASWTHKVAGQLPIVVNGSALSNPFELTAVDSGNTTAYFPMFYFNQALNSLGFTATWDGVNHVWNISAPGVDASKISITGGVGTGNTSVSVNGTVIKKINTYAALDPAAGNSAQPTSYFPAFYINEIFNGLGAKVAFSGQTGLSVTKGVSNQNAAKLAAITSTGASVGTGTQASPAVAFGGKSLTLSSQLTDVNGNPVSGVNLTLNLKSSSGAPTVSLGSTTLPATVSTSSGAQVYQYTVPTDSTGSASVTVSQASGVSANYTAWYSAPYNVGGTQSVTPNFYAEFVPANQLGVSPSNNFATFVSTSANPTTGLIPVTVTLPPNGAGTAQSGVKVEYTLTAGSAHAFYSGSNGGAISTNPVYDAYTDANGQTTVYLNANTSGTGIVQIAVNGYSNQTLNFNWSQVGLAAQVANISVTGYTTVTGNNYTASVGNNVTFQGVAQDASGNPVAAQILVVSNQGQGSYVSGTTTTSFPSVSAPLTTGGLITNPQQYGEVVTTDANGNFSFQVTDSKSRGDSYYLYSIAGNAVQAPLLLNNAPYTPTVTFNPGTTLTTIGVAGNGAEIMHDSQALTGISVPANGPSATLTSEGLPNNLPVVQFNGFDGKLPLVPTADATINQSYNLSLDNGDIWGVYVGTPNAANIASLGSAVTLSGNWLALNNSNPGLASATIGVQSVNSTSYNILFNGTVVGTVSAAILAQKESFSPAEYGAVKVALTDTSAETDTLTIAAGNLKATAAVAFTGGAAFEGKNFSSTYLTNGTPTNFSFNLEDNQGNPVAGGLARVAFKDTPDLWVTKVNGQALQGTETITGGVGTEATPIPLWNGSPAGYATSGVGVSGVASWNQSASGYQVVNAYADSKGVVTLTLQSGGVSYYQSPTVVNAFDNTFIGTTAPYSIYSPSDATASTATPGTSVYQIFVGTTNPGSAATNWFEQGQINW